MSAGAIAQEITVMKTQVVSQGLYCAQLLCYLGEARPSGNKVLIDYGYGARSGQA